MKKRLVTFKYLFGQIKLIVIADVTLGRSAKTYGEPEDCSPAEDAEVELVSVFAPWAVAMNAEDYGVPEMGMYRCLEDVLKDKAIAEASEQD